MYAIHYDFEGNPSENGDVQIYEGVQSEIKKVFADYGFKRQKESLYVGGADIDAVSAFRCVMALNEATKDCKSLNERLKNIRILEVEKNSVPN
ncbi:hypothetical protein V1L52_12740 [Treponema sp. HNW]|uniref:hypothetical protein n=1 Tax=Treponema sp. HNW TaxID=3116654 RepID=UPI003D0CBE21